MGLAVAGLGVWYALAHGRRRVGVAIAAAGAGWSLVAVLVLMPALRGGPSLFHGYYESIGGSPEGILRTVFTDPTAILGALTTAEDVAYVILLAAPLAGLFLLAPGLAAVALPQLLLNGLSDRDALVDPRYHYVAAIVPALVAGTVFGLRRVRESWQPAVTGAVLVLSIAMFVSLGPLPGSRFQDETRFPSTYAPHVEALHEAVALIPSNARLTSTNAAGAHLSARRHYYNFPITKGADWVILETRDAWIPLGAPGGEGVRRDLMEELTKRLESDPGWTKVFDRSDVLVFRRTLAVD
jgi:uncharacterized membrane protein